MSRPFCPPAPDGDELLIARLALCDLLLNRDQFLPGIRALAGEA